ncbi:Histidine kinase [Fibrobacter sp. UWT3]|uniref:sensor histidine kinase n=1 Tax=Fibrobacter sp. UWT3 TaxID=1896225 RepID=UPI000BD1E893|nr:histidine kinase [Fibrobacter sp. UWT3]SOE80005.1 Histidine kinase [Fibrobacter sp. UWT3]
MTVKKTKKAVTKFFETKRETFEEIQEASFQRSEKLLVDVLKEKIGTINYPFPPFVPIALAWIFIILFPLAFILDPSFTTSLDMSSRKIIGFYLPLLATALIFFINQKALVRSCIFKKHYVRYFIYNSFLLIALLLLREVALFLTDRSAGEGIAEFFSTYYFSTIKGHFSIRTVISFALMVSFVCVTSVFYNIILRQTLKAFLQREKKNVELQYELDFLKNQLSPHFLFNTLNNISALITIDPKRAEESMAKLSKLLRVMLYQTSDATITIKEDIDILQKYAELEKLRLDESYDLKFNINLEDENFQIAPLIAMPLVENAIKHSVNPDGKSFAHISITQAGNKITFETENSNYPRKAKSNAGGLGLATFKKRLDLLYTSRYTYETDVEGDIYRAKLEIITD